ncbi:hypothetical protein TBLA_0A01770 [Henningerozyma blattae CBS 6284]|uniref:Amino acid permease/ SLC12A domain-containing protein n=1 Tax=Henningerozyma blattae (strain ATCC 34711 / CBS 6284 / DSM 70876 / NBRC 10599 / NRRL Y-10934 / UCD 77-7) TaxID=1071380 RepID=I2GV25_HENB6|nr:hypothetical protein TBLA_0A01770 [Tetrapisispora blattae CBS 6284]CCH57977.1 hypothetical protein TBLA_0A01770 [Tetrapisispora blattae CBS 6284]
METDFYTLPGSHKPNTHPHIYPHLPHLHHIEDEITHLLKPNRSQSLTYFNYEATPQRERISSRFDLSNPNRNKLGTYDGVFIPTSLNVLSILMFLRFGFILGQLGILCTIGLLLLSYFINLLTTLSISAISTNGVVRGGGAYYMISRCLGPEFGGAIGLVFFLGQVFNSGMNAIGIVEPILYNFGSNNGVISPILPETHWFNFSYATIILLFCLIVALIGSQLVSKAGNILFFVLMVSIISIPISSILQSPFENDIISYTGPSWETFQGNLFPQFTKGAAGSLLQNSKETFNDLFGVFFPATAGIFAGAGMSSELRKPSKSIPKGTLWGLAFTFICYAIVVISMSFTIPRESLYKDVQIIQSVSKVQLIILLGELSTSIFSIIVGIVGAAYVLEAIAKDTILPGLSIFYKKPLYSILFTWLLTQLCLFSDVNKIATFITMTFLLTFIVMNLACFLLKVSSAPNFRPSFKYFDRQTACLGVICSILAMFIVNTLQALAVMFAMSILFVIIHYTCPPKSWGDVSQTLIYHQVRKYLLRLKQDNIKYWRPQILLFVDNPRTSWNLIRFCNHLKKGGLYVLAHVTVSNDFQDQFVNFKNQQRAWHKIRDMTQIKAFVQIGMGPTLQWGVRNVFTGSGLGGMKPNITVLGFFDMTNFKKHAIHNTIPSSDSNATTSTDSNTIPNLLPNAFSNSEPCNCFKLPTDDCKNENKVTPTQWVQILEDLSLMGSNIAVAHDFKKLNLPSKNKKNPKLKKFIDLYPVQMSAQMTLKDQSSSIITTNFDTYTLILQLGAILVTVPEWKHTHTLRVILFVEKENKRNDELDRMKKLLDALRIEAEVLVVSLDQFRTYQTIVKGTLIDFEHVNNMLKDDLWWQELVESRRTLKPTRRFSTTNTAAPIIDRPTNILQPKKFDMSKLMRHGISLTMTSNMPLNTTASAVSSEYSDEDSILPSMRDSTLSIPSLDQRLNYESSRRQQTMGRRSPTLKMLHPNQSTTSVNPVFSSNTIPITKILEDGSGDKPTLIPIEENNQNDDQDDEVQPENLEISPACSNESLIAAMENLGFNDMPSKAQHLILNDMMSQLSSTSDLIFSTLPLPPLGTHLNDEAALRYVQDLDIWLDGLAPTMLINSQSLTVTTAL